ncbi:SDR family NAD(P)-dependent oxidoreductase [Streptomyces poriferorum]|uniref:SDR family NAD(P)-dependent oxidoreductase n=1 Tax=Streptomyces poriferorum TaxID=2798799 RepID=UPI001C600D2B|nr:SDR family oxidoreductase [Streptomyces poriferorum]MBW5259296.1 SDR family oxidoreductase [Streptomyces poriferorum]
MNSSPAAPARRIVVVTGAGTGIGRATAHAFAARGATVLAVGRRPGPLDETAAGNDRIVPLVADITGPGEPERIIRTARETYGRLDVLVNNAALVRGGALGTLTTAMIEPQIATNLVAPMLLSQAALPLLEASGGVIVNVSTSIGQRAWPGSSVYAATKTALELLTRSWAVELAPRGIRVVAVAPGAMLTRSWAVELAPRGIRVVAVAPGAIATPIGKHQGLTPEQLTALREWQLAHTPLGRVGEPGEVAHAILHLASPDASFITGVILPVDGGAVVA